MKCPYCLSEIENEALVCKFCKRDLYLFKPLLAKIAALEEQLATGTPSAVLLHEERVRDLEQQLASAHAQLHPIRNGPLSWVHSFALFMLLPLGMLLFSHWLITIVLDTNLLYLRVISIAIPLPFGLVLFLQRQRSLLPWLLATVFLAVASVIGMGWLTSLVDGTPVLPKNAFEWREYLEYAASISFSFFTGMLIGHMLRTSLHRSATSKNSSLLKRLVTHMVADRLTPHQIGELIKKLEEYGGSLIAIGTTAMSIYTGLKGVLGS